MSHNPVCPVCEEGRLTPATYTGELEYNDRTVPVEGLEHYICDHCGADPVFEDQIRRNHRRYTDARRRVDRLLTGDQIRTIREELGVTQREAAHLFGGGANAFSKYERGDVNQSVAMDRLLRVVQLMPSLLQFLRIAAGDAQPHPGAGDYKAVGRISMNDESYRSRTVSGDVVEVENRQWTTTRPAA